MNTHDGSKTGNSCTVSEIPFIVESWSWYFTVPQLFQFWAFPEVALCTADAECDRLLLFYVQKWQYTCNNICIPTLSEKIPFIFLLWEGISCSSRPVSSETAGLLWLEYSRYLLKIKSEALLVFNVVVMQFGFRRTSIFFFTLTQCFPAGRST